MKKIMVTRVIPGTVGMGVIMLLIAWYVLTTLNTFVVKPDWPTYRRLNAEAVIAGESPLGAARLPFGGSVILTHPQYGGSQLYRRVYWIAPDGEKGGTDFYSDYAVSHPKTSVLTTRTYGQLRATFKVLPGDKVIITITPNGQAQLSAYLWLLWEGARKLASDVGAFFN